MIDRWPLRLALASIARPRLAVAALLAVTLAAAPGLARLTLRTDGHALVPPEDPAVLFDAEVRRHFDLRSADPPPRHRRAGSPSATLVSAHGTATAIHVGAPSSTGTARDRVD
jgi:hypothetical protein